MKKFISLLIVFFCFFLAIAQQNYNSIIEPSKSTDLARDGKDWIKFKPVKNLNVSTVFTTYKNIFKLQDLDEMVLIQTTRDKRGFKHYKFQQYYNGVLVEGCQYIIHEKDDVLKTGNGKIVSGLNLNTTPVILPEEAIRKAIEFVNAEIYMWEDPKNEQLIKKIKNNPNATYYPKADLVIVDKKFLRISQNYHLTYKVEVYAEKPLKRLFIYVDAKTGNIYHTINMIQTTDVTGIAVTKYSDIQTIITDSVSPVIYRLRDASRGNGVETYNMNTGTNYGAAVDFTDTDNYWDNVNAAQDEAATDAHWGAEMGYDYYFLVHGRNSYDNNGAKLLSYVHYGENYINAFWDGTRMTYGDGGPSFQGNYTALTSLDICVHEMTHGVVEYTANLIYQNESGALNEAFCDIFGTAAEFFAYPPNADWTLGEDIGPTMRSLSNPNAYEDPDTYLGTYWDLDPNNLDNGGVHTNSGVGNYWFYLLSEGGSGTNDNNNFYNVQGVGLDKAELIAYRALSIYLTDASQYYDAREAAILAAEDLYGPCSQEVVETASAWYAVGVGQAISNNDIMVHSVLSPVTACGLTSEYVTIMLQSNACDIFINPGDTIFVGYSVDNTNSVMDTIVLTDTIYGGDSIIFTFTLPADVSTLGIHSVDCWAKFYLDTLSYNDTLFNYQFENKLQQNIDVGVVGIKSPKSECHLSDAETVSIDVQFFGCDSLANDSIVVAYQADGGVIVKDTIILDSVIYPNEIFTFTFDTPADLSAQGIHTINSWTEFDIDTLYNNDHFNNYQVKNPYTLSDDTVTFEPGTNPANYYLIDIVQYCNAYISASAAHNSTRGLQMTGGDAMQYYTELDIPDGSNNWDINECLSVKVCFCVDATAWNTANMRFALKQTFSTLYLSVVGFDFPMGSNFRILANDVQIGGTYNPATYSSDPWVTHYINLDDYAGTNFTVCFETRNIIKPNLSPGDAGDNAYVDNVYFSEQSQEGMEELTNWQIEKLEIYPNPSNSHFNVKYYSESNKILKVEIIDILGKTVKTGSINVEKGYNNFLIDLNKSSGGIYLVKASSDSEIITKRIIKK